MRERYAQLDGKHVVFGSLLGYKILATGHRPYMDLGASMALSYCSPLDEWDRSKGIDLAESRLTVHSETVGPASFSLTDAVIMAALAGSPSMPQKIREYVRDAVRRQL